MRFQLAALAVIASVFMGCAGPTQSSSPRQTGLSFAPGDLSTGLDPVVTFRVLLADSSGADLSTLVEWVKSVVVLKDAAGRSVAFTAKSELLGDVGNSPTYTVTLTPGMALEDGWYALELPPDSASRVEEVSHGKVRPDGSVVVRFRVGSEPVLAGVAICSKDASPYVRLSFSEPIALAAEEPLEAGVSVVDGSNGSSLACSGLMMPATGTQFDPTEPSAAWVLDCGSVPPEITVEVTERVKSPSGIPVREVGSTLAGVSQPISVLDLAKEDSCSIWSP